MRKIPVLVLLVLCIHFAYSQNTIGIPTIINHSKEVYRAGNQNWDITQGADGVMYFANNDGLLSFDGAFWRLYTLPNRVICRSVAVSPDQRRIYVGGQEEFGYFTPLGNGNLSYTSLKPLIPQKDNDFADVWDIFLQDRMFFSGRRRRSFGCVTMSSPCTRVSTGDFWVLRLAA